MILQDIIFISPIIILISIIIVGPSGLRECKKRKKK